MIDAFDDADYYDCYEDSDQLSSESWDEAIASHIDGCAERGENVEATVRRLGPLTVYAFKRKAVHDDWIDATTERLADLLQEDWCDEFGDPEGDHQPDIDAVKNKIAEAIRDLVENNDVWQCDDVAKRTYTVEQILEALKH